MAGGIDFPIFKLNSQGYSRQTRLGNDEEFETTISVYILKRLNKPREEKSSRLFMEVIRSS